MKKISLLSLILLISISSFGQYKDWSKWSVTIEGGINRFDGDVQQNYNSLIPSSLNKFSWGVGLEYTPVPVWSIGIDYSNTPLRALKKATVNGNSDFIIADFNGKMNSVALMASFNLIKLANSRSTSKWGIWANVGLGYSSYHSDYFTDRNGTAVDDGSHQKYIDFNDNFDGNAMFYPVGLLIEYNLSKSFALGLKGEFRAFNKDYIEQRIQHGVTNDFVELGTLQLRYKFGASNKNHTRNAVKSEEVTREELLNLQKRIDGIVIPPDNSDKINDLDNRLKKLEDYLDIDGPDDDNDGVANSRDKEPNTPAGNQVDFWGRTISKAANNVVSIDESAFIYFDFDKTNLDEEAQKAIRIAAEKLKADPELLVEVRGFTDNMGSNNYNANLSQRRADVVKNELVKVYGIDPNRIVANGKGKFNPQDKTLPYRPYRTCILFYSK